MSEATKWEVINRTKKKRAEKREQKERKYVEPNVWIK